jgi:hypothetical protein
MLYAILISPMHDIYHFPSYLSHRIILKIYDVWYRYVAYHDVTSSSFRSLTLFQIQIFSSVKRRFELLVELTIIIIIITIIIIIILTIEPFIGP